MSAFLLRRESFPVTQVDFELLIRSRRIMRCNCIRYADKKQRDYLIDYADRMLEDLDIKI